MEVFPSDGGTPSHPVVMTVTYWNNLQVTAGTGGRTKALMDSHQGHEPRWILQ